MVIAGIRFFIKYLGFMKKGIQFKQQKLSKLGQIIGFIGLIIVVGPPRIFGVRGDYSEHALLVYLLIISIGTCLILIGPQFILAAYKSPEDTPDWIKTILKLWK